MAETAMTLSIDTSELQAWIDQWGPVYTAAPDLLAALKEIVSLNDEAPGQFRKRGGTRRGLSIAIARAAIDKAEGGSCSAPH